MNNLNYSLTQISDNTGLLPHIIASRVADENLDNTLPDESYAFLTEAFEAHASEVFVRHFNTSLPFRKQIARIQSIDDLEPIYIWFRYWFDGWKHRAIHRNTYGDTVRIAFTGK